PLLVAVPYLIILRTTLSLLGDKAMFGNSEVDKVAATTVEAEKTAQTINTIIVAQIGFSDKLNQGDDGKDMAYRLRLNTPVTPAFPFDDKLNGSDTGKVFSKG